MSKLTAARRRKIPGSDFAGPGRSFPINDPTHARMAISGATRSERAGNISESEEAAIKAKACMKLGIERGYPHEGSGAGGGLAVNESMNGTGIHDTHQRD